MSLSKLRLGHEPASRKATVPRSHRLSDLEWKKSPAELKALSEVLLLESCMFLAHLNWHGEHLEEAGSEVK